MPNTSYTQLALASDAGFRLRIRAALLAKAAQVLGEASPIGSRVVYANKVIKHPDIEAANAVQFLVMRTNVNGKDTTCAFQQDQVIVVSAATDADLESQVFTDWDWLAAAAAAT